MKGKATFLGHPIHPMVIVLPLGLLPAASVCDIVALFTKAPLWGQMAFWLIVGGIGGGLLAAVFGTIDWLSIPKGTRAKKIGAMHAGLNVLVMLMFGWSLWLRSDNPSAPTGFEAGLGFVAIAVALVSGWLGAELIYRLSIGVDDAAHPNASNSLTNASSRRASNPIQI